MQPTSKTMQKEATIHPWCHTNLLPPSMEELRRRITKRALDAPEEIERRMSKAELEMGFKDGFDFQIANDDLNEAAKELRKIFIAHSEVPLRSDAICPI